MDASLAALSSKLDAIFPISEDVVSLEWLGPESVQKRDGAVWVVVRLVVWERNGEDLSIRDVKEQEVSLLPGSALDSPRLQAFLEGWAMAVHAVFRDNAAAVETLMPHDLIRPEVLELARPVTPEDFAMAFTAKSRLGKFLPKV